MSQKQQLVNILSRAAPYMDGQRETRKRETADAQREKKDEHLKLLTMSRTILIYKNYKKFIIITPSKNLCKLPLMLLKQQKEPWLKESIFWLEKRPTINFSVIRQQNAEAT